MRLLIPKAIQDSLNEENKRLLMQAQTELSALFVELAAREAGTKQKIEQFQQQGIIQQVPVQPTYAQPIPTGQPLQVQYQQPQQYLQHQPQSQQHPLQQQHQQEQHFRQQQQMQQQQFLQQQQILQQQRQGPQQPQYTPQQQQLQQYIQYYQPPREDAPPSYEVSQAMQRQQAGGATGISVRALLSTLYRNL
jgi:hypothetical protein